MVSVTGTGANGSSGYGIAYGSNLIMQLPDDALIDSMMVTNTVWAWGAMTYGDGFADPMEQGKYFTLVIVGMDAGGIELGEVRFDLGRDDYIVSDWEKLDLSSLAGASQLQFSFDSNEQSWGYINYPLYFAFDDVVYYRA